MDQHAELYKNASKYLVGGVCSSARINSAIRRPFYVTKGDGSKLYDLNGSPYIDMNMSFGASILGHKNNTVRKWLEKALDLGIICGHETEFQSTLAGEICRLVPCAELLRFTGSGTEATMHAIRLAREYTGKDTIVKFQGHYHGCHDYVMFNWWPPIEKQERKGELRRHVESGGIPSGIGEYIIILPFNDLEALEETLSKERDRLAAVIVEPVNYNCGCVIPSKDYMQRMRELTSKNNIVLIYDEILSGFRMGPGGAQEYLGIIPDLCTLGKCIGGGTSLSAFCGKREFMQHITPLGKSFHSGTYNGHLLTIMGGLAFIEEVNKPDFYKKIGDLGNKLYKGLEEIFNRRRVKVRVQGLGARFGLYFGIDDEVDSYNKAIKQDQEMFLKFVSEAMERGVYFHNGWHHGFSIAHTVKDIEFVLDVVDTVIGEIMRKPERGIK